MWLVSGCGLRAVMGQDGERGLNGEGGRRGAGERGRGGKGYSGFGVVPAVEGRRVGLQWEER